MPITWAGSQRVKDFQTAPTNYQLLVKNSTNILYTNNQL